VARQQSGLTIYAALQPSLPKADGVAAVTMADPVCRLIFRGAPEAATAAGAAFGVVLTDQPCRAQQQGTRATLWLGPDEWLLLASTDAARSIASTIAENLTGLPHALVEISDRNIGLIIDGPRSVEVLTAGCPLDLEISSFPVDACTRTLFGKAEIVLWRTSPHTFRLEVARSFLPYVIGLLDLAVRDAAAMVRQ
jgi:sarcosine oxidase, subunit gamma